MKTLSFAASFAAMLAFVSCASNVQPPDNENAREWTPGIQASYPDWQPPQEMPQGSPEYAAAFGEPAPVEKEPAPAVVIADNRAAEKPVQKLDPKQTAPEKQAAVQVQPVKQEVKPAAPAKFMRVDVFPAEPGIAGVYAVNGERATVESLKAAFESAAKANKDMAVILFGRKDSAYADLTVAVGLCKDAGLTKLNVMTNDDILEMQKAQVKAQKGEPAAKEPAAPVRMKLAADPSQASTEYIVKDGDSLSTIAKALYHDGGAWEIIFDANKTLMNGKPNFLKLGMKLVIPAVKLVPVNSK